ncbi:hypothetical protein [Rhodococcus qingshengii]|nr:hypothetical protein [Rhodococcus qingshengii]
MPDEPLNARLIRPGASTITAITAIIAMVTATTTTARYFTR